MKKRSSRHILLLSLPLGLACSSSRATGFPGDGGGANNTFGPDQPASCVGLECKVASCGDRPKTSLRGKVYDPAAANPLSNVAVYIPSGDTPDDLPPLIDSTVDPGGIACETCASVIVNPLRAALTDVNGAFVLEDVPVAANVPIVVQVGKWRRLLHVDVSKQCDENTVPDRRLRLPRNGAEGDLPQIAVTSGGFDALECLLRGIGVDDNEFVSGHGGAGHIHMFQGAGGGMGTPAQDFWNDASQLRKYDVVLLSCEGTERNDTKGGSAPGARASMHEYLNAGGKVFATHFHNTWFKNSPYADFQAVAEWGEGTTVTAFEINQTFPKGKSFATWLSVVGVSSTPGTITLTNVTNSVKEAKAPAIAWILGPDKGAKYLAFNTPIGAPVESQCGRAVITDVHTALDSSPSVITDCQAKPGNLNGQQKAVEFLFFDLSACVTDDNVAPRPPK